MATVSKYNLILNGITATLVLDSKPDEHGRIDWALELMSDGNKTTTSSKLTITPKQDLPPKPDEPVQRQTAETEWPDNDGARKAMNEARELAAANAPKNVTEWPNDDAEREAFRARLLASRQDDEPVQPTASVMSGPPIQRQVATQGTVVHPRCAVSTNQHIYEALINKANSYPPDKIWQIRAYTKAAENLLTCKKDISTNSKLFYAAYANRDITGIGDAIYAFIYDINLSNN